MELKGKKIAILVEEMFNDHEFWYPFYRLKEAGAQVVVVGSGSAGKYTGKSGTQASPDVAADQVSASEFDGVIIPGGYAPDHMRRHPAMVKLVADLFAAQKVVADGNLITSRTPDDLPLFMRAIIQKLGNGA